MQVRVAFAQRTRRPCTFLGTGFTERNIHLQRFCGLLSGNGLEEGQEGVVGMSAKREPGAGCMPHPSHCLRDLVPFVTSPEAELETGGACEWLARACWQGRPAGGASPGQGHLLVKGHPSEGDADVSC